MGKTDWGIVCRCHKVLPKKLHWQKRSGDRWADDVEMGSEEVVEQTTVTASGEPDIGREREKEDGNRNRQQDKSLQANRNTSMRADVTVASRGLTEPIEADIGAIAIERSEEALQRPQESPTCTKKLKTERASTMGR
jgi:hypothetical protein